jgi:hypothetical protein
MSRHDINRAGKQRQRHELQQLVGVYLESGGSISRDRSTKVHTKCTSCGTIRYVHLDYALRFGARCPCGAKTTIKSS